MGCATVVTVGFVTVLVACAMGNSADFIAVGARVTAVGVDTTAGFAGSGLGMFVAAAAGAGKPRLGRFAIILDMVLELVAAATGLPGKITRFTNCSSQNTNSINDR